MVRSAVIEIINQTWPTMLICSVIAISMRIVYLIQNREHFILYKELMMFGFMIYILSLFYVVTFQDVSWSSSNFVPFREMFRYDIGSSLFIKNVLGNLLLFIPYGFFVSYFLKLKKPYSAFFLCVLTSITIETTQLWIGRVFDIDDIILNIVGGMLGYTIWYFLNRIKGKMPIVLQKPLLYNIIMVILLILAGLYLTNVIELGV